MNQLQKLQSKKERYNKASTFVHFEISHVHLKIESCETILVTNTRTGKEPAVALTTEKINKYCSTVVVVEGLVPVSSRVDRQMHQAYTGKPSTF